MLSKYQSAIQSFTLMCNMMLKKGFNILTGYINKMQGMKINLKLNGACVYIESISASTSTGIHLRLVQLSNELLNGIFISNEMRNTTT